MQLELPHRNAVDSMRKQAMRRLQLEFLDAQHVELKLTMWFTREATSNSNNEEQAPHNAVNVQPALQQIHTIREGFTILFDTV